MSNKPRSYADYIRDQSTQNWGFTGADPSRATNITDPTANTQQTKCSDCGGYYDWLQQQQQYPVPPTDEWPGGGTYTPPWGRSDDLALPVYGPETEEFGPMGEYLGDVSVDPPFAGLTYGSDQPRSSSPDDWNVNQFSTIGAGGGATGRERVGPERVDDIDGFSHIICWKCDPPNCCTAYEIDHNTQDPVVMIEGVSGTGQQRYYGCPPGYYDDERTCKLDRNPNPPAGDGKLKCQSCFGYKKRKRDEKEAREGTGGGGTQAVSGNADLPYVVVKKVGSNWEIAEEGSAGDQAEGGRHGDPATLPGKKVKSWDEMNYTVRGNPNNPGRHRKGYAYWYNYGSTDFGYSVSSRLKGKRVYYSKGRGYFGYDNENALPPKVEPEDGDNGGNGGNGGNGSADRKKV